MAADSDGMVDKVKDKVGSVLSGSTQNRGLVDEDPDIEYPEPLDLVQTDDGHLVMSKGVLDDDQQEKPDTAPDADADDTGKTADSAG